MHGKKTPKVSRRTSPATTSNATVQPSSRRSKTKSCISDAIAKEPISIPKDHTIPLHGSSGRRSFNRDKEDGEVFGEISAEAWDISKQAKVRPTRYSEVAISCKPKGVSNSRMSGNPSTYMDDKKASQASQASQRLKQNEVLYMARTRKNIHLGLNRGRRRSFQVIDLQTDPRVFVQPKEAIKRITSDHIFPLTNLESYLDDKCPLSSVKDSHQVPTSSASISHNRHKSTARSQNRNHVVMFDYEEEYHTVKGHCANERATNDENGTETSSGCGMPWHRSNNNHVREGPVVVSTGSCFRVPRRRVVRRGRMGYKCNSVRSLSSFDSETETAPLMTDPEPYHDFHDGFTSSSSVDIDGEVGYKKRLSRFDHRCETVGRFRRNYGLPTKQRENHELLLMRKPRKNAGTTHRSLSQKYRPNTFKDLIGQNMAAESLRNAILRGTIAPLYLFHGPRGTGKTTSAKIFTCAMNCLSIEELRPCGVCNQCTTFRKGQNYDVKEVDASAINDAGSMRFLLKHITLPPSSSRYKVFIVDGCHALASDAWNALLKSMEEPPSYVVFILITEDLEPLPRSAVSQCQKLMFPRIKDADIVFKLQTLAVQEKVEIELEAMQFIANRSDGSFRDAENMLDQLSLLGVKVTLAKVQEMVGLIPDGKLLKLLELALSGDTASTIKAIRELIESGVEPLALTSQLADMITDILAGKNRVSGYTIGRMKEEEEERLKQSLKILADSEKQLRSCDYQTTWLTAAFLQFTHSKVSSSLVKNPATLVNTREKETVECDSAMSRKTSWGGEERLDAFSSQKHMASFSLSIDERESNVRENHDNSHIHVAGHTVDNKIYPCEQSPQSFNLALKHVAGNFAQRRSSITSPSTMKNLWSDIVEGSCPNAVKQLLLKEGRLISLSITEAGAVARIEFQRPEHKNMAESVRINIVKAFHRVLGCPLKVEISLALRPFENSLVYRECDTFVPRESHDAVQEIKHLEETKRAIAGSHLVCSPSVENIVCRPSFGIEEVEKLRSSSEYAQYGNMTIDLRHHGYSLIGDKGGKLDESGICKPADGAANHDNYSSSLEGTSDGDASNIMCWTTIQRGNKGKHVRARRRRARFLFGLVPSCSKGERKMKQTQN